MLHWCLVKRIHFVLFKLEREMTEMQFYMPVKVYQEENCVWNHREEFIEFGKKALIITGKNSSKINGALKDIREALDTLKQEYVIFDEIEENPSIETVMKARDYGLQSGADYVIGIGGGSPLDAAKAIALMMKNSDRDADLLYSKEPAEALKVVAIPTTCGTGSEVTPYSILTIHAKRTKSSLPHKIFPEVALIDGKYLKAASHTMIANTAVDALGHFIESYCNSRATDYNKMICSYGLEVWARSKDVILGQKEAKEEDYINLMCASALAGMAITHTGTSLPHGMSYKITYEKGVPHGKAVGVFLAAYLNGADSKDKQIILDKLGMKSCEELHQFVTEAVGTVALEKDFVQEAVTEMMANAGKLANCPYPVDTEYMEMLYRESCKEL